MGRIYEQIDERWREWIARQPMFFVATAPLSHEGHVNVSPKGPNGTLRVLDGHTLAYLDVVGSGAETIAHLRENGRIVVMFCAFEGPPRILRLHGRGEALTPHDARYAELLDRCHFEKPGGDEARRAVVVVHVSRIADSCGYGVPLMTCQGERPHYDAWARKKVRAGGPGALARYQERHNAEAIDGLPAVPAPERG